ncbi:TPA: hypothetical protein I7114_08220 [Vibrio vulnificus]|nr:hypothetical protein [Vibrio vulnificus]HDY8011780.1 hypothetical protein [Vibrio vulnificus]
MQRIDFYQVYFGNIYLFTFLLFLIPLSLSFFVNKASPTKKFLDPAHFYISFTFGSAYSIVFGLYILGYVGTDKFLLVLFYAVFLYLSLWCSLRIKGSFFNKLVKTFLIPKGSGNIEFKMALASYAICALVVIIFVGFGFFAENNRFEQNKGFGVFVRILDGLRIFIIAYITITVYKHKGSLSRRLLLMSFLTFFCFFSAILNGAKFALLESVYAVLLSIFCVNSRLKINVLKLALVAVSAVAFAVLAYSINIKNNGLEFNQSQYIKSAPYVIEALFLRVLANADKYFLSLPGDVIDLINIKPTILMLLSPLIGSSRLSQLLGYNISDFSIGKQILLYWNPNFEIAGGPTSHFDLFAYVHFGYVAGVLWVIFTGLLLGSIAKLKDRCGDNCFYISVFVLLWLRGLPILLEPPLGIAYLCDVFIFFSCFKFAGYLLKRNG